MDMYSRKKVIDRKLDLLYKNYQKKNKFQKVEPFKRLKRLKPISVSFLTTQIEPISVR